MTLAGTLSAVPIAYRCLVTDTAHAGEYRSATAAAPTRGDR